MIGATLSAQAIEVAAAATVAPLLPGLVQHFKARLQGRRGPTPLQPYRELRRLWRKSTVTPEATSAIYRIAPSVTVASIAIAVAITPVVRGSAGSLLGNDALALAGLLALARFAIASSAWDTASGFALQGASRDLMLGVFVEGALVLALAVVAVIAGTTDLRGIVAATAGLAPWRSIALPLASVAFAVVAIAEVGRQPIDNPDTHLELTMIHEGPLLEYGGRDLAYLQWAMAARHWIVLVLAAGIFLPHPHSPWLALLLLAPTLVALCAALALVETLFVKMRILLVPRLLGIAAGLALLGLVAQLAGAGA